MKKNKKTKKETKKEASIFTILKTKIWKPKRIMNIIAFFIIISLSMVGALTVGRAIMGIIIFSSLAIPTDPASIVMFNYGSILVTFYVFYRLYKFLNYTIYKIYLIIVNNVKILNIIKKDLKDLERKQ